MSLVSNLIFIFAEATKEKINIDIGITLIHSTVESVWSKYTPTTPSVTNVITEIINPIIDDLKPISLCLLK